jgi:hypothetical protein
VAVVSRVRDDRPIDFFGPGGADWQALAMQSALAIANGVLTRDHRGRAAAG